MITLWLTFLLCCSLFELLLCPFGPCNVSVFAEMWGRKFVNGLHYFPFHALESESRNDWYLILFSPCLSSPKPPLLPLCTWQSWMCMYSARMAKFRILNSHNPARAVSQSSSQPTLSSSTVGMVSSLQCNGIKEKREKLGEGNCAYPEMMRKCVFTVWENVCVWLVLLFPTSLER